MLENEETKVELFEVFYFKINLILGFIFLRSTKIINLIIKNFAKNTNVRWKTTKKFYLIGCLNTNMKANYIKFSIKLL